MQYGLSMPSCSRSCTSTLGELLLRCLVSHRIAPGEFLSGGLLVQAPSCIVSPVPPSSSAPEGPIVARLRSLGRKVNTELPQYPELRLSRRFPGVVAKVFWAEEIVLVLHGPNTALRFPMTLLCQELRISLSVLRSMRPHMATVPRVHTP